MLKKDLILRNPLRVLGQDIQTMLPKGGLGAVLARAGLGKTAILVQIALDSLLQSRNVLHISLTDPVGKVCLWYEEVFRHISSRYNLQEMDHLWEAILPHRLVMTFNAHDFRVKTLEERLIELADQDIFIPQLVLVDGLPFDDPDSARTCIQELKALAARQGFRSWVTVRIHRHDPSAPDGFPVPLSSLADLFELAFQIQPEERKITIKTLKSTNPETLSRELILDPTTMLVQDPV